MVVANETLRTRFDFTVVPQDWADLPVTLMCNWGYPNPRFLRMPTSTALPHRNGASVGIADFKGSTPEAFQPYMSRLRELLTIDTFAGQGKNAEAPSPYSLDQRVEHMGKYRFIIIFEQVQETNW
jgi:hypothetical protein